MPGSALGLRQAAICDIANQPLQERILTAFRRSRIRHVRREFLRYVADPRSPERGQYAFLQGLIRDVAYGRLAKSERRTRHLAAARYFEALGEEEISGILAEHYLAAYAASSSGPAAAATGAQARVALKAAAERASGLGSPEQAL